jgi:hypothetical protein
MNSNFDKDIVDIKNKINKLNLSIKDKKDLEKIIDNTNIKNIKGNVYALSQFQYKVSSLNYRRNLRKNIGKKEEDINNLDNMEQLSKFISETDYNKKWNKLDNYQKKKKIIQYVSNLVASGQINSSLKDTLNNELLKKLKNNKLKSSKTVNYNMDNFKIESINILKILPDKKYEFN